MTLLRIGIGNQERSDRRRVGQRTSALPSLAEFSTGPLAHRPTCSAAPPRTAPAGLTARLKAGRQAMTLSPAHRRLGRWPLIHLGSRWPRRPKRSDVRSTRVHMLGNGPEELRIDSRLASREYAPVSPPGVIAGAILRAARLSANLARGRLARKLRVRRTTVRGWECGTIPLFGAPYGQLHQLAEILNGFGATVGNDLNELLLACQCDMLVIGMLSGEETYAEVPPIGERTPEGAAADALLRWAAQGAVPTEYAKLAPATPLIAGPDMTRLADAARELTTAIFGHDLAAYGSALLTHIGALRCSERADPDDRAALWDAYGHGP
jgi:transcriptional regulator with XRE-family HTH domain